MPTRDGSRSANHGRTTARIDDTQREFSDRERELTRRRFCQQAAGGLGGLAVAGYLGTRPARAGGRGGLLPPIVTGRSPISSKMRLNDPAPDAPTRKAENAQRPERRERAQRPSPPEKPENRPGALAEAFARARRER